jgi:diguanylate cyclase (GGDEF)-like protein
VNRKLAPITTSSGPCPPNHLNAYVYFPDISMRYNRCVPALLDEIIDLAERGDSPLPDILRKCLRLAKELKNDRLKAWVEHELYGYKEEEKVPAYRIVQAHAYGKFAGTLHRWFPRELIIPASLEENHRAWAEIAHIVQPVGVLNDLMKADPSKDTLISHWPPNMVAYYSTKLRHNCACHDAWQEIPRVAVIEILDAVRNMTLKMALEIREELGAPYDDPSKIKTAEFERVGRIVINNLVGDVASSGNANASNEVSEATTGAEKSFDTYTIVPLKDLPSKQACIVDLQSLLGWAASVAVLYLDLDNFKAVNDKYRHEGGDVCIEKAAEVFGKAVQHKGRLYRLHGTGDEFAILLPNFDQNEARATAERIRIALEQQSPGGDISVTASIGGVLATSEMSSQEILKLADEAMYAAKQIRNRVHFNTDEAPPPKKSSPNFKEISAMRDRDPDNENGQTPSPKEIAKAARKGSLYQRDSSGKEFVGMRVCWKLRLREIWDRKDLRGEIGVQFNSRGNLGPTVHVIVRLKDYPALKDVRGGEFCEITGVIERVESDIGIYLADASIKFLPEPPKPEDPFEMIMNA